jgi:hypothetical protein
LDEGKEENDPGADSSLARNGGVFPFSLTLRAVVPRRWQIDRTPPPNAMR